MRYTRKLVSLSCLLQKYYWQYKADDIVKAQPEVEKKIADLTALLSEEKRPTQQTRFIHEINGTEETDSLWDSFAKLYLFYTSDPYPIQFAEQCDKLLAMYFSSTCYQSDEEEAYANQILNSFKEITQLLLAMFFPTYIDIRREEFFCSDDEEKNEGQFTGLKLIGPEPASPCLITKDEEFDFTRRPHESPQPIETKSPSTNSSPIQLTPDPTPPASPGVDLQTNQPVEIPRSSSALAMALAAQQDAEEKNTAAPSTTTADKSSDTPSSSGAATANSRHAFFRPIRSPRSEQAEEKFELPDKFNKALNKVKSDLARSGFLPTEFEKKSKQKKLDLINAIITELTKCDVTHFENVFNYFVRRVEVGNPFSGKTESMSLLRAMRYRRSKNDYGNSHSFEIFKKSLSNDGLGVDINNMISNYNTDDWKQPDLIKPIKHQQSGSATYVVTKTF